MRKYVNGRVVPKTIFSGLLSLALVLVALDARGSQQEGSQQEGSQQEGSQQEGSQQEGSRYKTAQFTFSADPSKAVLVVTSRGGYGPGREHSMTLYGDGTLELKIGKGEQPFETHRRRLGYHEMETMLEQAVHAGLAEWDTKRIMEHQKELNNGKYFEAPSDLSTVTLSLAIENYKRGTFKSSRVRKEIEIRAPIFMTKYYPRIPEIEGVAALAEYMYDWIREVRRGGR